MIFTRFASFEDVLHADLGHDWNAPNLFGIHVARDMADALVPNVGVHVTPAVPLKYGVYARPTNLGVPKPQSCFRRRPLRPRFNVRFVPLGHTNMIGCVTFESENAVGTIRDDACRHLPFAVKN